MGVLDGLAREIRFIGAALRVLGRVKPISSEMTRTTADDLESSVQRYGDNPAFIFEDQVMSYKQLNQYANRVANWAQTQKVGRGDTVALFMQNRPEYVGIWFGLAKLGVVTALVNNQLIGPGLAHCIDIADADHVIVDAELIDAYRSAEGGLERPMKAWSFGGPSLGLEDFDAALEAASPMTPPTFVREGMTGADAILKIYTSGTTGLPKAAPVTHVRALNYMNAFAAAFRVKPTDRMMIVLPLYHSTGGLVGLGAALTSGAAVVLERKFSASRFWEVAARHGATHMTYVGELSRFLAASPPHPDERAHKIRGAVGNGLRPDVWETFQTRFDIPWIIEFYGSTEGNVSLINLDGRMGAVGRVPGYLKHRFNVEIIKLDLDTEEPIRDAAGRCVRAEPGEVGEILGEIRNDDGRYRFDGYAKAKSQTEKKILHDVFKKGDAWFRSGDLMRRDELGYFYFVDRIGDTFRWKSENVATSEVSEAISTFPGVRQANVYGVQINGYDGRAGMAAIVADPALDLAKLHEHMAESLPDFARPLFLRLQEEDHAHTTGTFKFKKGDLVKEGFDPAYVNDPLYFADPRENAYVPIDGTLYQEIQAGRVRV